MTEYDNLIQKPFYFIRHGESVGNVERICQGHSDYPLTPKGRIQAKEAVSLLVDKEITTIFRSPLVRASETADILQERLSVKSVIDVPDLMERYWGVYENGPNQKMFEQESVELSAGYLEESDQDLKQAGFESISHFKHRVIRAMNHILQHPGRLAVVGHGRFFRALTQIMQVEEVAHVGNAIPLYCDYQKGHWQLQRL